MGGIRCSFIVIISFGNGIDRVADYCEIGRDFWIMSFIAHLDVELCIILLPILTKTLAPPVGAVHFPAGPTGVLL